MSGRAAWVTFGEPDRGNLLHLDSVRELLADVRTAQRAGVHVLVLAPSGSAFSAGGDLAAFGESEQPGDLVGELAEVLNEVVLGLIHLDAIVVSVVQGVAAGAGFSLAAAADVVLAAESARFTLAYTRVGLTPDGGASLLVASLGLHRSLQLALLNPVLTARQAHDLGLVTAVHDDDELCAAAEQLVSDLLRGSRRAQVGAKRLLRDQAAGDPENALRAEAERIRSAAQSPDGREGVRAFLDKRLPSFGAAERL